MASLVGTALMQSGSANADTVVDNNHVQVVSGDTLSKIAQEHGTTVSQLAQDNNISNVDLIHVGDVIAVVPGAEPASQQNTTQNGKYTGKYQLDASYLNGDYSPANQEQVADQYVAQRYGSWSNAKQFWLSHNYY